ncbi:hypothetical protein KAFR_0F01900 [Kazachstania africana CBS 2517]|uniref:Uncharacterized protein n=1 Tax=Kazachstania africana (strain ATCC 22294 / BCRC 22015 / CBS 2517 / CECT 1963 / NBRC 1671 / NRRL Y-8276) TaxID=1071382 RepID=H2AWN7_KAZAF|nr:hypothetical protein KAFR_0F01900 [Kazachstania africana CBS 2517]CCF58787.1 hypothetical protein KAFR_0F01900 [Kazachstania africana CBS 2517]
MNFDNLPEDLAGELGDAIRKSWSESKDSSAYTANVSGYEDSPIGTPLNEPVETEVHEVLNTHPEVLRESSGTTRDDTPIIIEAAKQAQEPDYQLFKHHYSITENRDSMADILNDLDLGGSPEPPIVSPEVPLNFTQGELQSNQQAIPMERRQSLNTRRSSIQDVQWIRQLLNPRSSFSASSSNEPTVIPSRLPPGHDGRTPSKCWVTVLSEDSIEAIKSIIVLNQSLKLVGSKYSLYILHDSRINSAKLSKYHINFIGIPIENLNLNPKLDKYWYILSIFINLVNLFDLVCFIAPTCMVIDNIDELLESSEICDEIDNETCVLLTNISNDVEKESNDAQIIIVKPNNEVAMCIKEYFTVYDNNQENNDKLNKLSKMNDFDVLRELFNETWGHISSDTYVKLLTENVSGSTLNFIKIIDFKKLKPWNLKNVINDNTVCGKWCEIWQQFWKNT